MTTYETQYLTVQPQQAINLIRAIEVRDENMALLVAKHASEAVAFDMHIDGSDNGIHITLKCDGTWAMMAPIILGEAKPA